jgi:hypothetical protein
MNEAIAAVPQKRQEYNILSRMFSFTGLPFHGIFQKRNILGKGLVPVGQFGYDSRKVYEDNKKKYNGKKEYKGRRIFDADEARDEMKRLTRHRKKKHYRGRNQPEERIAFLQPVPPYQLDDEEKNDEIYQGSD